MPLLIRNINRTVSIGGSTISYKNLPSYLMPEHDHDALQVLVPLEGSQLEITWALENNDEESKLLVAGDLCIIPPMLEHKIRWMSSANFVSFCISSIFMDENVTGGFSVENDILDALIGFEDKFICQLAQSIRDFFHNTEVDNYKYFHSLLVVVAQHIMCHYLLNEQPRAHINDHLQIPCEKMRSAISFMANNLDKNLTVETIADEVGMSRYHFIRVFKGTTGVSPSKFHMSQRVEKSKELLKRNHPIINVAYMLGFSSQSHFSNVFRNQVGMTPKRFIDS